MEITELMLIKGPMNHLLYNKRVCHTACENVDFAQGVVNCRHYNICTNQTIHKELLTCYYNMVQVLPLHSNCIEDLMLA